MEILFLGTGAADWDWSQALGENIRGSCCTLLDGHILIDAGLSVWQSLDFFSVNPAKITDILITHTHGDHFFPEAINKIAAAEGRKDKLRLHCNAKALALFDDSIEKNSLTYGSEFILAETKIRVLPANHHVEDFTEETFHFLFDTPQNKRMLYAIDGAWMNSIAWRMLLDKKVNLIIWDATCGNSIYNYRFATHNDLMMIKCMRKAMENNNYIDKSTVHVFNHISKGLWPETAEERQKIAEEYAGTLAFDGMKINL